MATNNLSSPPEHVATVGPPSNFWLYSSHIGWDLTHPPTPSSAALHPRLTIQTTTQPITIYPPSTALIIIDMQNFFLSPGLGRSPMSLGLVAQDQLLKHAIPAAHTAGIRVVYLNWGLTDEDMEIMPPATVKAFGFSSTPVSPTASSDWSGGQRLENNSKDPRQYVGLGHDLGQVSVSSPSTTSSSTSTTTAVEAGRLLFRSAWNAALTPDLQATYETSQTLVRPDIIIHKNRLSGLWGGPSNTPLGRFLQEQGIKTLLFGGVNTDQCVLSTLTDAFTLGYDCILLSDGSATSSGESAQDSVERNCAGTYGFVSTCAWVGDGLRAMGWVA